MLMMEEPKKPEAPARGKGLPAQCLNDVVKPPTSLTPQRKGNIVKGNDGNKSSFASGSPTNNNVGGEPQVSQKPVKLQPSQEQSPNAEHTPEPQKKADRDVGLRRSAGRSNSVDTDPVAEKRVPQLNGSTSPTSGGSGGKQ